MTLLRAVRVALGPVEGLGSLVDHEPDRVNPVQVFSVRIPRIVNDVRFGSDLMKIKSSVNKIIHK